jgi:large subunit ribosomal protein L7/L12
MAVLALLGVASSQVFGAEARYSVLIADYDMEWKIRGIKAIREETGLGLADAKNLIESKNGVVKSKLTKAAADGLAKRLRDQKVVVVVKQDP